MKNTSTQLVAYPYPTSARGGQPEIIVEFNEYNWSVIKDTRPPENKMTGYLHCIDGISAPEITDDVRDIILRYYYHHPDNLPGIGATPQHQYFAGLDLEDRERIGNSGKRGYYA